MEASQETYLITAITTLAAVTVTLALYIKHLHSKYTKDQNENLLKMTEAMLGNKAAIESNTDINKEVKELMHTVNTNILEIKFNGNKKR